MDIAQSSKTKPQLSPYQEGVSKALKASGEAHASEALMQGVPPQHIEQQAGLVDPQVMQQLMQLAGQQVQSKGDGSMLGDKVGILPALLKTFGGTPTSPFQSKTEPLGLNSAIQLAGFQQSSNKNSMDAQKFPGEMKQQELQNQKLEGDLAMQPAQIAKAEQDINPEFQAEQAKKQAQAKGSFLTANDLFTKFESSVQPFVVQRDAYARIKEAGKEPSAAGDLALIYGYMKILDPSSTVREGEFATAQNSGSIPQRLQAMYNKVASGKRLVPEQRQDFLNRSQKIYSSAESQYSKTRKEFTKLAIANQLDPNSLIRDLGMQETIQPESTKQNNILPTRSKAPKGATGWDTEKGEWVY